jgi:hypothetical protein
MTLIELSELHYNNQLNKYKAMAQNAPFAIPRKKYTDLTANKLTEAITDFIRLTGGYADRINNMGVMRNGKWTRSGTRKGIADVMASKPIQVGDRVIGVQVAIEVKIGKDRQSEDQKKIEAEVIKSGGFYIIAKDWVSFFMQWDAI